MSGRRLRIDSDLPVRSLADVNLSEAVAGGECPVCVVRRSAGAAYLKSLLGDGVTDPQTRGELRAARGFCRRHAHALLESDRRESGAPLGAAILLEAALGWRVEELRAAARERGRSRRHLRQARQPAHCLVCAHVEQAVARAGSDVASWLADDAWRVRLAKAAFCIDDLLLVADAAGRSAALDAFFDAQLQRMESVRHLVDRYVHHSSQDRRHLQTDDERRAVKLAARLLGGD